MDKTVYGNSFSQESSGAQSITFPFKSQKLFLTNDGGVDLVFKLKSGASAVLTLKVDETLNLIYRTKSLDIVSGAEFRLWVFG